MATRTKKGAPNRLINETSTYLLQHAHNPVDWYPWCEEAISRARSEDKPILLSVGYAACHWCHVMEHESFEDEETAQVLNGNFVSIKVDREERTDIDEIYMKAVQLMTGHGGWPMTVFLTPELKPFFAGTYFPNQDRHGMPSFKRVLVGVISAWKERKEEVIDSSHDITKHLVKLELGISKEGEEDGDEFITAETTKNGAEKLSRSFDSKWGGFGSAPKFPHTFSLMLAMRGSRKKDWQESVKATCSEIVRTTLERMANGGIHDQLGGGFARYSVDRQWLIPHFEKMLYDNALLCQTYLDASVLLREPYFLQVAEGVLEFVTRELRTENGAFYSSLDADSEGEEGKFYVWKAKEIIEVLGETDGNWLIEVLGVTGIGNFEHGTNVLHFAETPAVVAKRMGMNETDFWNRLNPLKEKLMVKRAERVRPGRDEKVLTSWNSLMISAFVYGFRIAKKDKYLEEAITATNFIFEKLVNGEKLLRTWGQGKAKLDGYLDDYAYFVQALLDLASVDSNPRWYSEAVRLTQYMIDHFWDDENGGFYYTSDEHEELIVRPKNHFDGSVPSGVSVAVMDLVRLEKLSGDTAYGERARQVFKLYGEYMVKAPTEFSNMICALDFYLEPGRQIAVVHPPADATFKDMLFEIFDEYEPNEVVLIGTDGVKSESSLLAERTAVGGKPTVYICEHFTCANPVSDLESLRKQLKETRGASR